MRLTFLLLATSLLGACPSSSGLDDASASADVPAVLPDVPGRDVPSADVPVPDDAPYFGYCPEAMFPTAWNRSCGTQRDCYLGVHTRDCCGGDVIIAINQGDQARFEAAEAVVDTMCPALCECVSGTILEDGTTVSDPRILIADCVTGICVARFPMR